MFPRSLVAGWSSGTGLAGMAGTVVYILMNSYDVEKANMFLFLAPLCFIYFASFYTLNYLFKLYSENDDKNISIVEITAAINVEEGSSGDCEDYKKNKSLSSENFMIAFKKSYFYIVNLFLVKRFYKSGVLFRILYYSRIYRLNFKEDIYKRIPRIYPEERKFQNKIILDLLYHVLLLPDRSIHFQDFLSCNQDTKN